MRIGALDQEPEGGSNIILQHHRTGGPGRRPHRAANLIMSADSGELR